MTFIASVLARDGIAIVADSFTTTTTKSMEINDFVGFLKTHPQGKVEVRKVAALFKDRISYTRDYTDKLIKFDDYTGITNSGMASIDDVRVKDIFDKISIAFKKISPKPKSFQDCVKYIESELVKITRKHLKKHGSIDYCVFIVSHFSQSEKKPYIFKIKINKCDDQYLKKNPKFKLIEHADETGYNIVTEGQDKIIDRLLFGSLYLNHRDLAFKVMQETLKILKSRKPSRDKAYDGIFNVSREDFILYNDAMKEIRLVRIRELSLQEAVDFASLLMRITKDIQRYTEQIPTVGGLVKLATIGLNKKFKFIHGDDIIVPNVVY